MTSTWADRMLPSDAQLFAEFYPTATDFRDATLRSIRFQREGPSCVLRIDLPVVSNVSSYKYIQAHMQFLAIENMHAAGGHLPAKVSIDFASLPYARLAVTITGAPFQLSLTCADQVRFGKISFHNSAPESRDDGPHYFTSKVNQMLYTTVPGAEAGSYHDRI